MLTILFEDDQIIVVQKPVGIQAQAARGFAADMVSLIQTHLAGQVSHNLCTKDSTAGSIPYVGVIHRLDKPVSGVMVYAKTKMAAAYLSTQFQQGKTEKIYYGVVCGKPVENLGTYVDFLSKDKENNCSAIVDKSAAGAKRAELSYVCRETIREPETGQTLSLLKIMLKTGRHHQIRVQLSARGMPLWGDNRYHPDFLAGKRRGSIALSGVSLSFAHPVSRKKLTFSAWPDDGVFWQFPVLKEEIILARS